MNYQNLFKEFAHKCGNNFEKCLISTEEINKADEKNVNL